MQVIKRKIEPNLAAKLNAFSYQHEAFKALCGLDYSAIFLEQGLGKTKIAIDLLLYWLEKKEIDTIIIVTKRGLINNWLKELKLHSYIKPKILTNNRKNNYYCFNSPARVLLTHFEAVKSEIERIKLFLSTRSLAVIIDESAKIKNPNSSLTKSFFEIAPFFKKKVIMTGTPVANRPFDIWAQIYFLDQGKTLGCDYENFKNKFDINKLCNKEDNKNELADNLSSVTSKISAFTYRKTKDSGVINLPNKTFVNVTTEWEVKQYEMYKEVRDNLRIIVTKDGLPSEDNSEDIIKRLLRLIQITSNPILIDESYNNTPGKIEYLNDLINKIILKKEKCIIWSAFTENVDYLTKYYKQFGVCKVHGKMLISERDSNIENFINDENKRILIATPAAAKEGLTLTVANNVIFYDRSFSLDDYLQAQDRIHRISQKKICNIYNLIMEQSIDQWIDILLINKELSAKLTQGDISKEYYKSKIVYEFTDILKNILNIKEDYGRD